MSPDDVYDRLSPSEQALWDAQLEISYMTEERPMATPRLPPVRPTGPNPPQAAPLAKDGAGGRYLIHPVRHRGVRRPKSAGPSNVLANWSDGMVTQQ